MIHELRTAIELIRKCPEEVQRLAAAVLSVRAAQHEIVSRLALRKEGRAPRPGAADQGGDPRRGKPVQGVRRDPEQGGDL